MATGKVMYNSFDQGGEVIYEPVEVTLKRKRRALLVFVSVLAIAAAVVLAAGGLGESSSTAITMQPGDEIDEGMMIFTVSSATAEYQEFNSAWRVVVTGKVRNPNSESLDPIDTMYGNVMGVDRATGQYDTAWVKCLGASMDDGYCDRYVVPPDSEWMDIQLRFNMEEPYTPSDTFQIVFRPMEYRVAAVLGISSDKEWAPVRGARNFVVYVPLTRLPD